MHDNFGIHWLRKCARIGQKWGPTIAEHNSRGAKYPANVPRARCDNFNMRPQPHANGEAAFLYGVGMDLSAELHSNTPRLGSGMKKFYGMLGSVTDESIQSATAPYSPQNPVCHERNIMERRAVNVTRTHSVP